MALSGRRKLLHSPALRSRGAARSPARWGDKRSGGGSGGEGVEVNGRFPDSHPTPKGAYKVRHGMTLGWSTALKRGYFSHMGKKLRGTIGWRTALKRRSFSTWERSPLWAERGIFEPPEPEMSTPWAPSVLPFPGPSSAGARKSSG